MIQVHCGPSFSSAPCDSSRNRAFEMLFIRARATLVSSPSSLGSLRNLGYLPGSGESCWNASWCGIASPRITLVSDEAESA
jgi:hypothetical protein